MFARRLATFLLGMWLGCCLLVDALLLQGVDPAERVLSAPLSSARPLLDEVGFEQASVLLRHLSSETTRNLLTAFEPLELIAGAALLLLLVFTDSRKPLAIGLGLLMVAMTAGQYFFVIGEWAFLGRQLDFLPEAAAFTVRTQVWSLSRAFAGLEAGKLLVGAFLASYLFAMESTVKRRVSRHRHKERAEVAAE